MQLFSPTQSSTSQTSSRFASLRMTRSRLILPLRSLTLWSFWGGGFPKFAAANLSVYSRPEDFRQGCLGIGTKTYPFDLNIPKTFCKSFRPPFSKGGADPTPRGVGRPSQRAKSPVFPPFSMKKTPEAIAIHELFCYNKMEYNYLTR